MQVKPFLKWAGGKTQLLAQFKKYYSLSVFASGDVDNML